MRTKCVVITRLTYEADAEHIETADDLDDLVQVNVRGGELTPVKLGWDKDNKETLVEL